MLIKDNARDWWPFHCQSKEHFDLNSLMGVGNLQKKTKAESLKVIKGCSNVAQKRSKHSRKSAKSAQLSREDSDSFAALCSMKSCYVYIKEQHCSLWRGLDPVSFACFSGHHIGVPISLWIFG